MKLKMLYLSNKDFRKKILRFPFPSNKIGQYFCGYLTSYCFFVKCNKNTDIALKLKIKHKQNVN